MGFLNTKKTKSFLGLILITILLLLISSNQILLNAKTVQDFKLSAKGYCGFIYLEWEEVKGADRYWIYRGMGEGKQESMPLTDFPIKENYYKDTKNLVEGQKYCYIVKAVDANAKEFAKSIEACAIPTCSSEQPQEECKLILQFQIGNKYYWVNGEQKGPMLTEPVLRWDRTFLIIRHVTEETGGEISWDGANQIVTIITKEGKKIEFQIGNRMYKVNGVSKQIDPYNPNVVPFIANGRTLIPLRVTGEELNAKEINWYGDKRIAELVFTVPCPEKPKGRIDVRVPENCIKGTYIEITDLKNRPITIIKEQKGGVFSTGCTLPCPNFYIVKPVNPNCTFYPESQQVDIKECCPSFKEISFKCECKEENLGRIIVKMPDICLKDTKVIIYDYSGNIVWSGGVNSEGVFDTGCTLKCPGEYKVVPMKPNFVFVPESHTVNLKDCCPGAHVVEFQCREVYQFVQKICACLVRMTEKPDENGYYQVYVKLNCKEGDPPFDLVLNFPQTLLDSIHQYSIINYYNLFSHPVPLGLGCMNVEYDPTNNVVLQWSAYPDKKPCCEELPSKGGRIVVKMPKECLDGTKVTIFDESGTVVWSGMANKDGVFDTDCTLKCPGIYKVFPQNEKCKFDPETQVVKVDCCPDLTFVEFKCECVQVKNGRIIGYIPKDCIDGTIVHIIDSTTNKEVWYGYPGVDGVFDTECNLACPGIYIIRPENKNCTFIPNEIKVQLQNCCPERYEVKFNCQCKQNGRLQIKIPKECSNGTVAYLYDETGKLITTLYPNSEGYFDTGCDLPCPGVYIVKPYNPNCKFYPETQKVEIKECCPSINLIEFKCDCVQLGRIVVKIPIDCIKDSKLTIFDENGVTIWSGLANIEGIFDTGCILKCPGVYTIKPYNPNCKFYPETQKVEIKECCPSFKEVSFKCSCCFELPNGLVAWWTLDETSGPLSNDLAGVNNVGTWINNPLPTTGMVNGALNFFGKEYVEVNNHPELNFGKNDFSIDLWIRTTDTSDDVRTILDKRTGTSENPTGYALYLYKKRIGLQIADGTFTNYNSSDSLLSPIITDGNWHHIAVTVNRNNPSGIKFYVDGNLVATFNPTTHQGSLTNTSNLVLGKNLLTPSHIFIGTLDEVELFNRALSHEEIKRIYEVGNLGKCKPKVFVKNTLIDVYLLLDDKEVYIGNYETDTNGMFKLTFSQNIRLPEDAIFKFVINADQNIYPFESNICYLSIDSIFVYKGLEIQVLFYTPAPSKTNKGTFAVSSKAQT